MVTRALSIPQSIQEVVQRISQRAHPKRILLFGSRARGNHRENSDFDLAVIGKSCSETEWAELLVELSEKPYTLYTLDVVEFERLAPDYQKNILAEGKVLYG